MDDCQGYTALIVAPGTMWSAVDALVEHVGPGRLRQLNFRAGEHLAAILTTSFLGVVPTDVDTSGGADLVFNVPQISPYFVPHITKPPVAFEIKSLPGQYRRLEYKMNRIERPGGDIRGMRFDVRVTQLNKILNIARREIERARKQLEKKAPACSQNVFIVVHMFDHLPAEFLNEHIYGPHLAPLKQVGALETVWILWDPYRLTVWSAAAQEWVNLMFSGTMEDEEPDPRITGDHDILQEVELYFLEAIGEINPSPYVFGITHRTD